MPGLDPTFDQRLNALLAAANEAGYPVTVLSGYRSPERQAELWADAVRRYGSEEEARKWVAPPGRSFHNQGLAADIGYEGRGLSGAPPEAVRWLHDNAARFGLHFPLSNENWHIEMMGTRNGTLGTTGAPAFGSTTVSGVTPRAGPAAMPPAGGFAQRLAALRARLDARIPDPQQEGPDLSYTPPEFKSSIPQIVRQPTPQVPQPVAPPPVQPSGSFFGGAGGLAQARPTVPTTPPALAQAEAVARALRGYPAGPMTGYPAGDPRNRSMAL